MIVRSAVARAVAAPLRITVLLPPATLLSLGVNVNVPVPLVSVAAIVSVKLLIAV